MTRDERAAIARALADAEDGTTGRIGVRVIPDSKVDAFERAKREFKRVRLHRHASENAALILIAPKAQRFAIIGDRFLHNRVGDEFWRDVVEHTQPYLSRGETRDGIVYAIGRIGEALHAYFPLQDSGAAP
jgi:uncharacterized membrane protein